MLVDTTFHIFAQTFIQVKTQFKQFPLTPRPHLGQVYTQTASFINHLVQLCLKVFKGIQTNIKIPPLVTYLVSVKHLHVHEWQSPVK